MIIVRKPFKRSSTHPCRQLIPPVSAYGQQWKICFHAIFSGTQSIDCCWTIHPYLFPIKKFVPVIPFYLSPVCWFYHLSVIMVAIVHFIILVLSWVSLLIWSFWYYHGCYCYYVVSCHHIVMVKHCFGIWNGWRCIARQWDCIIFIRCFGGHWVGFSDSSGNSYPTYMFTLCFMCFNFIFTHFIFCVPVFYFQKLINRQRLQ